MPNVRKTEENDIHYKNQFNVYMYVINGGILSRDISFTAMSGL